MQTARRFLITILVPALIVSIFAVGSAAAQGSSGKVNLCHFADHKFVKISISMNAKPAHMSHGDVDPDEYGDCSDDHDGDHDGDHEGDQEGNHDGQDGDSSHWQGERHKSSQSQNGSGGSEKSKGHGDSD